MEKIRDSGVLAPIIGRKTTGFISALLLSWTLSSTAARAELIVHEDFTPNAEWPETPVAMSGKNPQISNSKLDANNNILTQTFIAPRDFTLNAIAISYWTAADNSGSTFTLSIFEVEDPLSPTISASEARDLLGGGSGLSFTTSVTTNGSGDDEDLLILELSGKDLINLKADTGYAVQITGESGVSFFWGREGSGSFTEGQGYLNGVPITEAGPRDLKMALYENFSK